MHRSFGNEGLLYIISSAPIKYVSTGDKKMTTINGASVQEESSLTDFGNPRREDKENATVPCLLSEHQPESGLTHERSSSFVKLYPRKSLVNEES